MSEELEKVKPTNVTLNIKGKERTIRYGFSAWAKLEDMYGGLKNLANIEQDIQNKPFHIVPDLIWIGLVEKDDLERETFLDEYGLDDVALITEALKDALYGSLPQEKKKANAKTTVKK